LRLSGIQSRTLVCGRVVDHLNWRLARSVRPYVASVNVGSVITEACGVPSRCVEVRYVPDAMGSSSRKVELRVSRMGPIVIKFPKWFGEVCIPCFCISSSWAAMKLVMSSGVDSGMHRCTVKALVVAESAEWTPVRYELSMSSGEWAVEIGRRASGLWRLRRLDGWWM